MRLKRKNLVAILLIVSITSIWLPNSASAYVPDNLDFVPMEEKVVEQKPPQVDGKKIRNRLGIEFVYIQAGTFMMGSAISPSEVEKRYGGKAKWYKDEHPQHRVTLATGFYMQATEVTQRQWKAVMGNNPSRFKGDDQPVEKVSWDDIQEFIRKLNRTESGNRYRLPTEAEWEYAARAGSTTRYSWGNNDDCSKSGDGLRR